MSVVTASTSWGGRASRRAALATAALAGLLVVPVGGVASAQGPAPRPVVVTGVGAAAALERVGADDVQALPGVPVALATVSAAQERAVRAHGLAVSLDAPVRLDDNDEDDGDSDDNDEDDATDRDAPTRKSVREIAVPRHWRGTGAGTTVAVVDSGVDPVPGLRGRLTQGVDLTGHGFRDEYGHGTFDASLIAGDGAGAAGPTGIVGVAPEARIVSVKVADARGRSTVGRVAMGIAWVIAHRDTHDIDVLNLSLSAYQPTSYHVNPLNALVEAAWFSGITVVASSGNTGRATVNVAPGNDPFVLTVGSAYDHNTSRAYDDTISPFTDRGRTLDGFRKPELLAPGQHVQAALPTGSVLAKRQLVRGLPAGYGQLSGTSMATAVASGLAALLIERHPQARPDSVKGALAASTTDLGVARLDLASRQVGRTVANAGLRPSIALAAAYAQLFLGTTDYASVDWAAVKWGQVAWGTATWSSAIWTKATWTHATWSSATWSSATWSSATWSSATWSSATWSSATWSSATWSSATWCDATWSNATWAS